MADTTGTLDSPLSPPQTPDTVEIDTAEPPSFRDVEAQAEFGSGSSMETEDNKGVDTCGTGREPFVSKQDIDYTYLIDRYNSKQNPFLTKENPNILDVLRYEVEKLHWQVQVFSCHVGEMASVLNDMINDQKNIPKSRRSSK